ncbi:ATP-binding protein [Halopseudomonas pachastrellae]|nr:ATP-binding protein [Halopseudomonas pachastrellae]
MQTLQSLYPNGPQIQLQGELSGSWPFDREDLLELLGNLLDNACKWARAEVRVAWHLRADQLDLEVADDGPGIAPAECDQVLGRGARLDQQAPGHGWAWRLCGIWSRPIRARWR